MSETPTPTFKTKTIKTIKTIEIIKTIKIRRNEIEGIVYQINT